MFMFFTTPGTLLHRQYFLMITESHVYQDHNIFSSYYANAIVTIDLPVHEHYKNYSHLASLVFSIFSCRLNTSAFRTLCPCALPVWASHVVPVCVVCIQFSKIPDSCLACCALRCWLTRLPVAVMRVWRAVFDCQQHTPTRFFCKNFFQKIFEILTNSFHCRIFPLASHMHNDSHFTRTM